MNWPGVVFGGSLALAFAGAAGAAFAQRGKYAVLSLSGTMFGVAGVCLALGNVFIAVAVAAVLGAAMPAVMLAALLLAPLPEPDTRADTKRGLVVAIGITLGFGALAWLLTATPWPPPGGTPQSSVEWLGSRLLTDHLITLVLVAVMLGLSGLGAVAMLRGRRRAGR